MNLMQHQVIKGLRDFIVRFSFDFPRLNLNFFFFFFLDKYRPVLILGLGLLTEPVVNKLIDDFQDQFLKCKVDEVRALKESMDQALQNNVIVDYKRRGSHYECTTVQAIREARVSYSLKI